MGRYEGYKDVLVNCYEGNVLVRDIPNCIKKSDVIDIARLVLKPNSTCLNNIEYVVNPNILDLEDDIKDGFIIVAEYVDISK